MQGNEAGWEPIPLFWHLATNPHGAEEQNNSLCAKSWKMLMELFVYKTSVLGIVKFEGFTCRSQIQWDARICLSAFQCNGWEVLLWCISGGFHDRWGWVLPLGRISRPKARCPLLSTGMNASTHTSGLFSQHLRASEWSQNTVTTGVAKSPAQTNCLSDHT